MAIDTSTEVFEAQLWSQGDIRDPLGVWAGRTGVTGDATGGSIKVGFESPIAKSQGLIYTCYSVTLAQLTGTLTAGTQVKARLLTNWPNADPLPGIQGYATLGIDAAAGSGLTAPIIGAIGRANGLLGPNSRFLLLFDPRARTTALTIVELEWGDNTDLATYAFESYGYYWDRSVLNAPGGPRHPGAS